MSSKTVLVPNLDVTTVIFANRTYEILKGEFANVQAGTPGKKAVDMLNLDRPTIDWLAMATLYLAFTTRKRRGLSRA